MKAARVQLGVGTVAARYKLPFKGMIDPARCARTLPEPQVVRLRKKVGIIDEAFMADQETLFGVINICVQLPLREKLRRPGAIALFGYRDVLLFGDLRQLPPASGSQPFWATESR